ncbi:hypothetical protein [Streptomyces sp. NPDC093260]|uniref:hypothetical protein n=1 Tax=Streptomyces sp. NPDC093260 TaxID=3155073 RepID=UPI00343842CD
MPDDLRVLTVLGIDPHALEAAPDGPSRHSGYQARIHPLSPERQCCSACDDPAVATRRLDVPGLALRWLDSCRDCMIAAWTR